MINEQIHSYKILSLLGEGGMANVYLAYDSKFESEVAIKILKFEFVKNKEIRTRFFDEAKILNELDHPNIVKVKDFIDAGDIVAFVMEFIDGKTIDQLVLENDYSFNELKSIFHQMISAIEYVHIEGLVHRDIKPSNFIVAKNGKVKLLDFGVAKNISFKTNDPNKTLSGQIIGTPFYMSPEQIISSKDLTNKSDIYSLGVTLWFMVMKKQPYEHITSNKELDKQIEQIPLPLTYTIWDTVIQEATIKNPKKRTIQSFYTVDEVSDGDTIIAKTDQSKKYIKILSIVALSIGIIALIGTLFYLNNNLPNNQINQKMDAAITDTKDSLIVKGKDSIITINESGQHKKQTGIESEKVKNPKQNTDKDIDYSKFEAIAETDLKVNKILIELLPNSSKYRDNDKKRFDDLLIFAFNNFESVLPTDKNSQKFINLCNLKNDLYYQLNKSKIEYSPKKINDICL